MSEKRPVSIPKRSARWTLMLIGHRGETLAIPWLKGLVLTGVVVLAVSFIASLILGWAVYRQHTRTAELTQRLKTSEEKRLSVEDERNTLVAKLMIEQPAAVAEIIDAKKASEKTAILVPETTSAANPPLVPFMAPPAKDVKEEKEEALQPEPPTVVDIDSFDMRSENGIYRIRFNVHNVKQNDALVSGFTFAAFNKTGSGNAFLFVPETASDSNGHPIDIGNGQFFSISKFKTVTLHVSASQMAVADKTAITIYIYNENKQLLLKKHLSTAL